MFKKILIANRGEVALRVIRTCREMKIKTVAVYSTADKDSLHVRFADEAVCIGPVASSDSYLNMANIISAAEICGVDAIHPGYGFLAENAEFSQLCEDHGIKFIGPSAHVINSMGDKSTAKDSMKKAGVPVVPGSDGLLESLEQALEIAEDAGYPVLLKATAGGGGKGMRKVHAPEEMEDAWNSARAESGAAFGNDGLYLEKFVEEPRHVEIQVMADQHGNVYHLGERDCTIQRRHQKLVEESPCPVLTPEKRALMGEAAVKAAQFVDYEGAGTVEFLFDKHANFYFMEMNTRIQVEHPVTEELFDVDLIKEQIRVAAGEKIEPYRRIEGRCSMEVRINAEDVFNDFRPSPGKIIYFHKPGGHNVRVDTHAFSGYMIPPYYDSMIGKLIITGNSREDVINRMERALDEFIVEGVKTTIPFHQLLMKDETFQSGVYSTAFLENFDLKEPVKDEE
ncbi:acetyl-CoA carboxylase biotin carboxylase subunit [Pontibacter sp. G13]|uniref:acetyl-CoA carboxylase biotin carboxylase subunit n=1 Tax=Pontibacter sp. G13 TaxID=3074898 RepID=UPI002889AA6C|nr:acetyl-CoA carboxylase biotin carboxylase subunit [Pontibacter sp. G13]WNJ16471.1 acetyl-CoA carboxylase biotin carboxylase subunit [Pontibacter sp. G13]